MLILKVATSVITVIFRSPILCNVVMSQMSAPVLVVAIVNKEGNQFEVCIKYIHDRLCMLLFSIEKML